RQEPERKVDEMGPQIHDATATRGVDVVEPGLVRTVCVVENQIHGENLAEVAPAYVMPETVHPRQMPIGKVDLQAAIDTFRGLDNAPSFARRARQRFLAEDSLSCPKGGLALCCVQSAGGSD